MQLIKILYDKVMIDDWWLTMDHKDWTIKTEKFDEVAVLVFM